MKKVRKAHLWIGLITSIVLLFHAITGLLLSEPWLIGEESHHELRRAEGRGGGASAREFRQSAINEAGIASEISRRGEELGEQDSLYRRIRDLHAGEIAGINIRWLVDVVAISIIFLTVSGIYLSIKILRAQRRPKKHQLQKG